MATVLCARRLQKEYMKIKKSPIENIEVHPLEDNILEWHYCLTGTKGSLYEGGYYHGVLKFPPEYPMKPPSVIMYTPNGRFKTHTRLCLSMSDYHPETWNPMWSVSTILMGLYSFMLETTSTLGSIRTPKEQVRKLAKQSLENNCQNKQFRILFPHFVDLYDEEKEKERLQLEANGGAMPPESLKSTNQLNGKDDELSVLPLFIIGAIACIVLAFVLQLTVF
mmetsp:Transcript_22855/g.29868  ORF Transcript_22855/g.29868 Transcript_22855/m.29868 type:complete len:222 (-) Transcript_22855:119-784(-)